MTRAEYLADRQRQAAQFRSAAESATTPGVKTLLLQKAEEQERLAQELIIPEQLSRPMEAV